MSDAPLPEDALSAYLDGELDAAARAAVELRLSSDAEWRRILEEVSDVRTAVRALPAVDPPPGFWDRVLVTGDGAAPDDAGGATVTSISTRRRAVHWARLGVAGVVAATVAVAFLLPTRHDDVTPTIDRMADAHAVEAATTGQPVVDLAPLAVAARTRP